MLIKSQNSTKSQYLPKTGIRIAGIEPESIVDGEGVRYVIFAQGCPHHCPDCHNTHTHNFNGGVELSIEEIYNEIVKNPLLDGVTFSGGEPFEQASEFAELAQNLRLIGLNIIAYTGYKFEYLYKNSNNQNGYKKLLDACDYVIDGRFEKSKKSYLLNFVGSANQRIIDCKKSIKLQKIVTYDM